MEMWLCAVIGILVLKIYLLRKKCKGNRRWICRKAHNRHKYAD